MYRTGAIVSSGGAAAGERALPAPETPVGPELPPVLWDPAEDGPRIAFEPADMSTATFNTLPTIVLPVRGLSERQVASLASIFELVTWPEQQIVATTHVYLDEAGEGGRSSRIVLQPSAPLADRWYAVRGHFELESDWQPSGALADAGETRVSRFRVGRGAVIQRVVVEALSKGGGAVSIRFSEIVSMSTARSLGIVVGSESHSCRLENEADAIAGTTVLRFFCESVAPGAHVRISDVSEAVRGIGDVSIRRSGEDRDALELDIPADGKFLVGRASSRWGLPDSI